MVGPPEWETDHSSGFITGGGLGGLMGQSCVCVSDVLTTQQMSDVLETVPSVLPARFQTVQTPTTAGKQILYYIQSWEKQKKQLINSKGFYVSGG